VSKRPKTKTKTSKPKWRLAFWRAVGEFKDGERKMVQPDRLRKRKFIYEATAKKAQCANWRPPFKAFVYQGRAPKRVTEIQINYPAE
jgi:hypothetical protein